MKNLNKIWRLFALFLALFLTAGVAAQPDIEITPLSHDFGEVTTGDYLEYYFTFSNTGTETVHVTDITFSDPAFSIQYTQFNIAPGESGQLPVKFKPAQALFYNAKMNVFSNDPDENPVEIELTGVGVVPLVDGWEWINTGFDYILVDLEFPCGQSKIGYAVGQANTYNGEGIVLKTTDGGTTWQQMTAPGTLWLDAISFVDTLTGYVGGWDNYMLKTTDGGVTWSQVSFPTDPGVYKITDIEFRDAMHGVVGVATNLDYSPAVFVTSDGGQTWTKSTGYEIPYTFMMTYVTDSVLVAVGGQDRICRSTDGGLTWSLVQFVGGGDYILLGVDFYDENYGLASGDYGHVYKTHDGGQTWNVVDFPNNDALLHTPYIWDEDTAWIVGTPELVYKTTNGNSWQNAYNGNFQRAFYRILFTDNYTGFISASHGVILRKAGFPEIPEAEVSPDALDFGDVTVGDTATLQVVVKNKGYGNLDISGITSSNAAFTVDVNAFSVRPRREQVVNVMFAPDADGTFNGELLIHTNDPAHPVDTVWMTGAGVIYYPDIDVTPATLDFGVVDVVDSAQMQFTVSNQGDAVLNVSGITSSNGVFTVDMTSFDVAPGENQVVTVTFNPVVPEAYSGELTIFSNDPDEASVVIFVMGEGVVYQPVISINPTSLEFDTVLVNQSAEKMFEVSNTGNKVLNVTAVTSSDDAFTVNLSNFMLEPGDSQEIVVTFTPDSPVEYNETITVNSDDPQNPVVDIVVHGYGTVETGINGTEAGTSVIYPNPAQNILYISNAKGKEIRVFDLSGRMVYYTFSDSEKMSMDVSALKEGFYLFKMTGENGKTETRKIKVQH